MQALHSSSVSTVVSRRGQRQSSRRCSSRCSIRAAAAPDGAPDSDLAVTSRRRLLHASIMPLLLPAASVLPVAGPARAEAAEPAPGGVELRPFVNEQQQYRLAVPSGWEQKGKAGADVLFEDPGRPSTSVGVTVSPVRVASIQQFGELGPVGQRLLDVERKKESTLGVALLSSGSRTGAGGALLYDYEYTLDSTRGTKRIFNSVTITGSKLYILNANFKCDKEAGCAAAEDGDIALLRSIASTFDAGSLQQ